MSGDGHRRAIDAGRVLGALRAAGIVGPELRSLTLDRAWPWGEAGLCALYHDRRQPPGRREWTVIRASTPRLPSRLRRAARDGRLRHLPELGSLVLPPASDPELPLAELLDGELASRRLRRWLGGGAPRRPLRPRPRGYKPLRRLTVEYSRAAAGGPAGGLFGKALRRRDLPRVEATWEALASSTAAARLALPRAVVRRWGLAVFAARPGTGLDRLIPGPAAARGVALAGESLALLHGGGAGLPARHPRRREVRTLDRWLGCAARACPEMAGRLGEARRRLAESDGGPVAAAVPSHRDFHPGQLLVAPGGVTLLDLDTAAMAEPELDAGNFLAHLDLFQLTRRTVPASGLAETFRAAYERRAAARLEARRLLWYRAAAVLRLACVYRFRPRGAPLGALLTRRCLDLLDPRATTLEVI